ncbi:MAG: hypothetical protein NEHIOOID_00376 [Holosporales bacterium]
MYKLFFLLFSVAHGVEGYSYSPFEMELGKFSPSCTVQLSKSAEYAFKIKATQNMRELIIHTPCPVDFSLDGFEHDLEKCGLSDEDRSPPQSISNASISSASGLDDVKAAPSSESTTSQTLSDFQSKTTPPPHKTKNVSFINSITDHFEKQEIKKALRNRNIQNRISKTYEKTPQENEDHKLTIEIIIPKNVDVILHPIYDKEETITFGPIILKNHE